MKLFQSPFEKIKSGRKTIEIRLFDEKRQALNLGDIIEFSKLPEQEEKIRTKVTALLRYPSFRKLLNDFGIEYYGYPKDYNHNNFIRECHKIYTPEQEQQYGILGIKIQLIQ
jgi:ASC-1-like (ASCH) protein